MAEGILQLYDSTVCGIFYLHLENLRLLIYHKSRRAGKFCQDGAEWVCGGGLEGNVMKLTKGGAEKPYFITLVLFVFMTIISCFAAGNSGKEKPDEEAVSSETVTEKGNPLEEEKTVFGRGVESGETLSEDVVWAFENGDTESLVGVAFGEEFDYDVYYYNGHSSGNDTHQPKEPVFEWTMDYYFEGKGHRFSGFRNREGEEEPFLGIRFGETPASIFVKAFGEPDVCKEVDNGWGKDTLSADWYFEKAVLTVVEKEGLIVELSYKALRDAADGSADAGKKSDYELRMENKSVNEIAEAAYGWGDKAEKTDVYYPLSMEDYSEGEVNAFIESYLQEQGFDGQSPDSVIYDREELRPAECRCYIDDKKDRFCFVFIEMVNERYDIYGAVRDFREAAEGEHFVYECDEAGNTVRETQYDIWGMRQAEASYQYHDGIPFPFLTDKWNVRSLNGLCREQKTWFYEEGAVSDKKGNITAVDNSEANSRCYFHGHPCSVVYRQDGKAESILGELSQDDLEYLEKYPEEGPSSPYTGRIDFEYSKDGKLKKIDYGRSEWCFGSGDMSGYIDFDDQERMVHNRYYMTHGSHRIFYFYHGDERRPWAELEWWNGIGIIVYRQVEQE